MKITRMIAHEIYDSQGNPALRCEIELDYKYSVISSIPFRTVISSDEPVDLCDHDRLLGKGSLKAVEAIENIIAPYFIGKEPHSIDMDLKIIELDGTHDKSHLGANAMLASSVALYKAESLSENVKLFELVAYFMNQTHTSMPYPLISFIINDSDTTSNSIIKEFNIMPVGTSTFRSSIEAGILLFHELSFIMKAYNISYQISSYGSFLVNDKEDKKLLDIIMQAVANISEKYEVMSVLSLSSKAFMLYDPQSQTYVFKDNVLTSENLIDYYNFLIKDYPLFSIEDALSFEDNKGWSLASNTLSSKIHLSSNNLITSNIYKLHDSVQKHLMTSAVVTPYQVGTLTEALQIVKLAKDLKIIPVLSGGLSETEDTFIADLAVGAQCGYIKAGGLLGSEHLAKYNRLLMLEDYLSLSSLIT